MCRERINILVTPESAARERLTRARLLLRALTFIIRNADAQLELFLSPAMDFHLMPWRPVSVFITRDGETTQEWITQDEFNIFPIYYILY